MCFDEQSSDSLIILVLSSNWVFASYRSIVTV